MADEPEIWLVEPTATQEKKFLRNEIVPNSAATKSLISDASAASVTAQLQLIGQTVLNKAGVAVNASVTPPAKKTQIQNLPEFQVTGVQNNQPLQVTCIKIGGFTVEKFTGYDYLSMQRYALYEGIQLHINSAFRSFEEQARLYAERVNPDGTLTEAGKQKGIAGKPGNGPHQRGTALDIGVGMNVADLKAGRLSAAFIWLTANAIRWGFERTVPSEPWHWSHAATVLVGPVFDEDTVLSSVRSDASLAAAIQIGKTDAQLFLDRATHDLSKAQERSARMTRTTRSTLYANMARESVIRGSSIMAVASRYSRAEAAAAVEPPQFTESSTKPATFDFTTGTWGDGERV